MKVEPTDALIVVDVQVDFCFEGALAVSDADGIIPLINRIRPLFGHVVFTRDWHPPDHCSFADPPTFQDGGWPVHCVAGTPGAAFHPDLEVPDEALVVSTAVEHDREAYSGFEGTSLAADLEAWGARRLFVCGLATDYCVKHTALDGVKNGFEVMLIEDACRGVDVPPGTVDAALREMAEAGVTTLHTSDLE